MWRLPAGAPWHWLCAVLWPWLLCCYVQTPQCCFWWVPVAGPCRLSWPGGDGGGGHGCTGGCCGLPEHWAPPHAQWGSGCGPWRWESCGSLHSVSCATEGKRGGDRERHINFSSTLGWVFILCVFILEGSDSSILTLNPVNILSLEDRLHIFYLFAIYLRAQKKTRWGKTRGRWSVKVENGEIKDEQWRDE